MSGTFALRSLCLFALFGMAPGVAANSAASDAELCVKAATDAAAKSGVPVDVLMAIAIVETGRDGRPWPWTVTVEGQSHWAETGDAAAQTVRAAIAAGLTNVDLGCFQLNLFWHSTAFQSVEDMLDPFRNATYAAEFLATKYAETGDWSLAAAAYHSGTPEVAETYQTRFDATRAGFDAGPPISGGVELAAPNRFPLLVAAKSGTAGSLVPATSGGLRLIGGP